MTRWFDGYDIELLDMDTFFLATAHRDGQGCEGALEQKGDTPEEAIAELRAEIEKQR